MASRCRFRQLEPPQSVFRRVGAVCCLLFVLSLGAAGQTLRVMDAEGIEIGSLRTRVIDNLTYVSATGLRSVFGSERLPVRLQYRFTAPTGRVSLRFSTEEERLTTRMRIGQRTVEIRGGEPLTLPAPPIEDGGEVWLPLDYVVRLLPSVFPLNVRYDAIAGELTMSLEALPEETVSTGPEDVAIEPVPSEGIPYRSMRPKRPEWAGLRIALDPGHGGDDTGVERFGLVEKELTLALAKEIANLAQTVGGRVYLTRTADLRTSTEDRVAASTKRVANVFVSLHFNSSLSDVKSGYRIVVHRPGGIVAPPSAIGQSARVVTQSVPLGSSRELAAAIDTALQEAGFAGEQLELPVATLRKLRIPAVHVEIAYLSNPTEAGYWKNAVTLRRAAEAIWAGLARYRP